MFTIWTLWVRRKVLYACVTLFCAGVFGGIILESLQVWPRLWSIEQDVSLQKMDIFSVLGVMYSASILWTPFLSTKLPKWIPISSKHFCFVLSMVGFSLGYGIIALSTPCSFGMMGGILLCFMCQMTYDTLVVMHQKILLDEKFRGIPESVCFNGYRLGMTVAVSGALLFTQYRYWGELYGILCILTGIAGVGVFVHGLWTYTHSGANSRTFEFLQWSDALWTPLKSIVQRKNFWKFLTILCSYRIAESIFTPNRELFFVTQGITKSVHASMNRESFWWSTVSIICAGLCSVRFGVIRVLSWGAFLYAIILILFALKCILPSTPISLHVLYVIEQCILHFGVTGFFAFQTAYLDKRYALTQATCCMAITNLSMQFFGMRAGWIQENFGWTGIFSLSVCGTFLTLLSIYCIKKKSMDLFGTHYYTKSDN